VHTPEPITEPLPRRPLSRRIMVVLFVLVLVPIAGWSLVRSALQDPGSLAGSGDRMAVEAALDDVRGKLALVLVASFAALGGAVLYLRRTVLEPLVDLARRARAAETGAWEPPAARERPDEIGDLARALDGSVTALRRRAEGAAQLAANLSHELRTPLSAIRGAAELIDDDELSVADRRRFAGHITHESERLERLVRGLLDMQRADRDGPGRDEGRCGIGEVAAGVIERARPLLDRKQLRAVVEVRSGLPPVAASPERAARILLGLLENAIKFSPAEGTLRLGAAAEGDRVAVTLADEGPGVPPELREAVFDRYFTAAAEGGAGARGTGLGLAIVQSLVEGAGGRIAVDDAPGGGARFRFTLPAARVGDRKEV
jgi:two-component system sensor histidine kinase ChvG